jgi:LPXTG-site transpeptidase (sortase) family protein
VTLTHGRPEIQIATAVEARTPTPVRAKRVPIRRRVVAITTITIAAALGALLIFQAFQGPFAGAWYRTRQRALIADFNGSHAHTGAGHAIAIMQVPRLGVDVAVAEGDSPQQLRGGPAHRVGTPLPGALGNSVIVGHAHDWGKPFSRLRDLHVGDLIAIQTYAADSSLRTGVFTVKSTHTIGADDLSPFVTSDDFRLTLVTGLGGRFSDRRFVVTAVSGAAGRVGDVKPGTVARTSAGSALTNSWSLLAVLGLAGAAVAFVALRRRYHLIACCSVAVPLATLGVLGLLFDLDLLLSPLR